MYSYYNKAVLCLKYRKYTEKGKMRLGKLILTGNCGKKKHVQ